MNDQESYHPNAEIVELLRRVRDLLDGPKHDGANHAKVIEHHAFTAAGLAVEDSDPLAVKWSLTGALAKLGMPRFAWTKSPLPGLRDTQNFDRAFNFLYAAAVVQGPRTPNGHNNESWAAARDLLDFAILLAEEQVAVLPQAMMVNGAAPSLELRRRFEAIAGKRPGVEIPN